MGSAFPKMWKEALEMDKENGDHLWEGAVKQEMKNSRVDFQACDDDIEDSIGFKQMTCHSIFNTKLSECFRRKTWFVPNGHEVSTPPLMSHSTAVPRDSVRISLLVAALNDLDTLSLQFQKVTNGPSLMEPELL